MPTCECPEDRSGRNCEQGWPFTCSIQLVSPQLPCSDFFAPASLTKQLYTSPQCRLYSVHDEVQCRYYPCTSITMSLVHHIGVPSQLSKQSATQTQRSSQVSILHEDRPGTVQVMIVVRWIHLLLFSWSCPKTPKPIFSWKYTISTCFQIQDKSILLRYLLLPNNTLAMVPQHDSKSTLANCTAWPI